MKSLVRIFTVAVVVALLVGAVSSAAAQDWPQWRGPARDGVAAAFDVPARLAGHAAAALVGGESGSVTPVRC